MLKSLEGARLGIFIFLGTTLLVIGIFLLGSKESLFVDTVTVKSYFESVEGLKRGAPVRLSGINVGSVSKITLVADSTNNVEVTMNIDKTLIQFIRLDSECSIETEGLVGTKILIISPGSVDQPVISDGSVLKGKTPVKMSEIIEQTTGILEYTKNITKDFSQIVEKINAGNGTIGKLVNDDRLYEETVKITQSADSNFNSITKRLADISDFVITLGSSVENIIVNVDTSVADIKKLVNNVEQGQGVLGALIADRSAYDSLKIVINNLVTTTEESVQGAQAFSENMEALKHNWLFKSYFEERGYWDVDEKQKELNAKIKHIEEQNKLIQDKIDELKKLAKKLGVKLEFEEK